MKGAQGGLRPIIFGTAGHIDHGKTTLTRALTGQNTDRLPEEKSRGISIDLGFAHFVLDNGQRAALIDVPGHEKFVRNMVSGVHGMDAVMLVVAADEGVMPQTQEHLDILQLLGVRHGLTVVTKADMVEEDFIDLVQEMVKEAVAGTFLAHAPLVVVDALSGRGLQELHHALIKVAQQAEPRATDGPARLPVDRIFSVKGFGSVVTGTLVSGTITVESTLELVPSGEMVRVRGLEVHGQKVSSAMAGQRVAVNLAGVEREHIQRGYVLATPASLSGVDVFAMNLQLLSSAPVLEMNARVHCHSGTAESVGRIYLYADDELSPGQSAYVELRLETPMPIARGDQILLRSYSPVFTIGGGTVLEVGVRHRRREPGLLQRLDRLAQANDDELAIDVIKSSPRPVTWAQLIRQVGVDGEGLRAMLQDHPLLLQGESSTVWWVPQLEQWVQKVTPIARAYQEAHPLLPGIPREQIRSQFAEGWSARDFSWVLELSGLVLDREWVRVPDFKPEPSVQWTRHVEAFYKRLQEYGLKPPTLENLHKELGIEAGPFYDILQYLGLEGRVVRLDDNYYITQETLDQGIGRVKAAFDRVPELGTSELKEVLETNRRFAVLFLELLDALRITQRVGEARRLRS